MGESVLRRPAALRSALGSGAGIDNYVAALVLTILLITGFAAVSPDCRHWFVLPLALCGVLTGADVIAWLRGQFDTFDPRPLVSMLLFHNMTLAPLLHEAWQAYTPEFDRQIEDWNHWFGQYSALCAVAYVCYRAAHDVVFRNTRNAQSVWVLNDARFATALTWAVGVSAVAAAVVLVQFGGLRQSDEAMLLAMGSGLQHLSWLIMLGDALPLLLAMAAVRMFSDPRRGKSMTLLIVILGALAVAQFALLGLRGSRSAFMFTLVIAAGMMHYRLRKIPVRWAVGGAAILLVFIYFYGFYKRAGTAGFAALQSTEQRQYLEAKTGNTVTGVLLGELSRAEIQSFLMYRLEISEGRYEYRWGSTYFRALITFIPRAIWYNKPPGKVEAGTDLQVGQGVSATGRVRSSRVYGLGGEAILNFGLAGVPLMFAVYGAALGWYRRKLLTWAPYDARLFLAPILLIACLVGVFGDADNLAFGLIKQIALPGLCILYASTRTRSAPASAGPLRRTAPGRPALR